MASTHDIQAALDSGKALKAIAEELGITVGMVQYRIAAFGLIKPLPKKSIQLRQPRPAVVVNHSKPASRRRSVERDCISCNAPFFSDGPHNRMCSRCRSQSEDNVYSLSGASKK